MQHYPDLKISPLTNTPFWHSLEIHFSLYLCNHYIMQSSFKQAKLHYANKNCVHAQRNVYIHQNYTKKISITKTQKSCGFTIKPQLFKISM